MGDSGWCVPMDAVSPPQCGLCHQLPSPTSLSDPLIPSPALVIIIFPRVSPLPSNSPVSQEQSKKVERAGASDSDLNLNMGSTFIYLGNLDLT